MYKKPIIIIQGAMYNLQKLSKFRPPCSNFTFLLIISQTKRFWPHMYQEFYAYFWS
jgi:hypothetical protein